MRINQRVNLGFGESKIPRVRSHLEMAIVNHHGWARRPCWFDSKGEGWWSWGANYCRWAKVNRPWWSNVERDMVSSKRGEEKVLNLQPWWPWRFKEQVLSQSTDSLTNCNLFCNLGLLIISSLLQQKLLLRLAIATKIFVAISF